MISTDSSNIKLRHITKQKYSRKFYELSLRSVDDIRCTLVFSDDIILLDPILEEVRILKKY